MTVIASNHNGQRVYLCAGACGRADRWSRTKSDALSFDDMSHAKEFIRKVVGHRFGTPESLFTEAG